MDRGPFDRTPTGVEGGYWQRALAAPETPGDSLSSTSESPYLAVLKPLASTEIGSAKQARRIQTGVLSVVFAVCVFVLTTRRAGAWPAVAAGVTTVLAAPLALGLGELTPAPVGASLLLLALVFLDRNSRLPLWMVAGVLAGVATRFHPLLSLSLILVILAGLLFRGSETRRFRCGLAFAGGVILAVGLTSFVNSPRIPTLAGIDMYRGHRAEAAGITPRRSDTDFRRWWTYTDYAREASLRSGRYLPLREAHSYWARQGFVETLQHPAAEIKRVPARVLGTLQGDPLPRSVSAAFLVQQNESPILSFLIWAGRILIPLGLWGLLWSWRRGGMLHAAALSGLLAATITFAHPDARFLTLAACSAGVGLWINKLLSRDRNLMKGLAGTLFALGAFGFWPVYGGNPGLDIQGDDYFFLGTVYDREGRGSAAIREYDRALRMDPDNPYPNLAIAAMLARDNVNEEAVNQLEQYRGRYPDYVPVLAPLTQLYQAQERWLDAAAAFGELTRLEPWNAEHWNNLGTMYFQIGYYEQATQALESALKIDPSYATAQENLEALRAWGLRGSRNPQDSDPFQQAQEKIMTHVKQSNFLAAEQTLKDAYETFGADRVELQFLEGTLRLLSGETDQAIQILEKARKNMPNNTILLFNLGAGYRDANQLEKAKEVLEEALRLHPSNERVRKSLREVNAALGAN